MEAVNQAELPLGSLEPNEVEIAVKLATKKGMSLQEFLLNAIAKHGIEQPKKVANFSRDLTLVK